MSEHAVLVLSPVTHAKWVPEAYEVTAGCGHQCWLSPGSEKAFVDPNIDSKCIPCLGGQPAIVASILSGAGRAADPQEVVRALRRELGLE
jgi:hypothetical protein